jgi:hypothetical protein
MGPRKCVAPTLHPPKHCSSFSFRYFSLAITSALLSGTLQTAASAIFDVRLSELRAACSAFHITCHPPPQAAVRTLLATLFRPRSLFSVLFIAFAILFFLIILHSCREIPPSINFTMLGFRYPPSLTPQHSAPLLLLTLSSLSCSNKIFAYILAAQVAISSLPSPASAIAAACR